MAATHPVLAPTAGLTSGKQHIASNRWDPVKESSDYADRFAERRVKSQLPLPVPNRTAAYTNEDIAFSHPTNRPLLACNGLPRNFKIGSRCVNPLEPRYVLPGCSAVANQNTDVNQATSPAALGPSRSMGSASADPPPASPSPRRPASERLLIPAMSLPRSADSAGSASSPRLQPLLSPSNSAPSSQQHPQQQQQQQQPHPVPPGANTTLNINGAVGGLLLYGPTAPAPQSSGGAVPSVPVNRSLDVSDINGQRRSTSVPPRRNGGFDPLQVADIVAPRRPSPTRPIACLSTADIAGAAPRARTREVASPGRGTLNSSDIPGASPGCLTRASPSTYALGRWPAPAVPNHHFAHTTRVTMLKKPVTIGE